MSGFENMSFGRKAVFGIVTAVGALTAGSALEAKAHNAYIGAEAVCSDGIGSDTSPEGRVYPSGFSDSIGNTITLTDNGDVIDQHLVTEANFDDSYTFQLASGNHSLVLSWENNPGGTPPITGFLPLCEVKPPESSSTTSTTVVETVPSTEESTTTSSILEETTTSSTTPVETTSTTAPAETTTTVKETTTTSTSSTPESTSTSSTPETSTTVTAPSTVPETVPTTPATVPETTQSTVVDTVPTPSTSVPATPTTVKTPPVSTPPKNVLPPTGTESLMLRDLATYFVGAGYALVRFVRRPLRAFSRNR